MTQLLLDQKMGLLICYKEVQGHSWIEPAKIFGLVPKWKGTYLDGGGKKIRLKNEGYILLAITWITPF